MGNTSSGSESPDIGSLIRDARFVFGGLLVDDTPAIVECVDDDNFPDEAAVDMALGTAVTSITADLIPFVIDTKEAVGEPPEAEIDRLNRFETVTDALPSAGAYYFLVETEPGRWKRVRYATSGQFEEGREVSDHRDGRFRVAAALVDEARERIADLPDSVDGEEIQIIDWS